MIAAPSADKNLRRVPGAVPRAAGHRRSGAATHRNCPGSAANHFGTLVLRCARDTMTLSLTRRDAARTPVYTWARIKAEGPMPIAHVRGTNINYEVLGTGGPWVALSPGGRRAL